MTSVALRGVLAAFLGVVAGRLAWAFVDELVGLEASARSAARGVRA